MLTSQQGKLELKQHWSDSGGSLITFILSCKFPHLKSRFLVCNDSKAHVCVGHQFHCAMVKTCDKSDSLTCIIFSASSCGYRGLMTIGGTDKRHGSASGCFSSLTWSGPVPVPCSLLTQELFLSTQVKEFPTKLFIVVSANPGTVLFGHCILVGNSNCELVRILNNIIFENNFLTVTQPAAGDTECNMTCKTVETLAVKQLVTNNNTCVYSDVESLFTSIH